MSKEKVGFECWKLYEKERDDGAKRTFKLSIMGDFQDIIDCMVTVIQNILKEFFEHENRKFEVEVDEYYKFCAFLATKAVEREMQTKEMVTLSNVDLLKEAGKDGNDRK